MFVVFLSATFNVLLWYDISPHIGQPVVCPKGNLPCAIFVEAEAATVMDVRLKLFTYLCTVISNCCLAARALATFCSKWARHEYGLARILKLHLPNVAVDERDALGVTRLNCK